MDTWSPWLPPGSSDQFYPVPKHPQQFQSLKASLTPAFTTCVPSARPLLSAPQFPHMSHELIRVTALWSCCRIKPVITWKWLEQSVNRKVGVLSLLVPSKMNLQLLMGRGAASPHLQQISELANLFTPVSPQALPPQKHILWIWWPYIWELG